MKSLIGKCLQSGCDEAHTNGKVCEYDQAGGGDQASERQVTMSGERGLKVKALGKKRDSRMSVVSEDELCREKENITSKKRSISYGGIPRVEGLARDEGATRKSSLSRILALTKFSNEFTFLCKPTGGKTNRPTGGDHENDGADKHDDDEGHTAVSDVIGSFGLFQLLVLLFSGLREASVGYDALIMSLILLPEFKFVCTDNMPRFLLNELKLDNNTEGLGLYARLHKISGGATDRVFAHWNGTAQCYSARTGLECEEWAFENNSNSLVAKWALICHNHWLIAFIESAYFFGLVTGNLTWGYCADKFGRRPAYLVAHTMALIFGALAVFMESTYLFALCRFLSAFGSIGYNIIYTIQVELIGVKHRSFSTILNHLGWGLGVVCIPLVDRLFNDDYRLVISMAPMLSLLMYPWAFWMPESSRWLMANGRFEEARNELIRAAKFNRRSITPKLEEQIQALERKTRFDKCKQEQEATGQAKRSYKLIFTDPILLRDTLIVAYLAFVGHLFYYLQTINFSHIKNLSTEANFITSGAGEWVSVIVGAVLLSYFARRTCMSLFLFIMTCSFSFQSLIESDLIPELDTSIIVTTNNGLGTLSSLLLIFIALIVNQEVYPTIVRQTGTSITNTVGEFGSTLAPLLLHISTIVGPWRANAAYTIFCMLGIVAAQFLTKTDDIELPDN